MMTLAQAMAQCPLFAILRGLTPPECESIGAALLDAGFRIIEVPLNSPEPLTSIRLLAERFGARALIGAGTVLTPDATSQVAAAGGKLIVMPHGDPDVIEAARPHGLACVPGVATPTEAFAALAAGADALKMFPGEALPPAVVKAWRAVLPDAPLIPVGGIGVDNMAGYVAAGAAGFGIGSTLYKPGKPAGDVHRDAVALVKAYREAAGTSAPA